MDASHPSRIGRNRRNGHAFAVLFAGLMLFLSISMSPTIYLNPLAVVYAAACYLALVIAVEVMTRLERRRGATGVRQVMSFVGVLVCVFLLGNGVTVAVAGGNQIGDWTYVSFAADALLFFLRRLILSRSVRR